MNSSTVISVDALAKRFDDVVAVAGLSFECDKGEIFWLRRTRRFRKIDDHAPTGGVTPPSAGSIEIEGADVVTSPERVKLHVSYMPQWFGLYEDLTVDENIEFFANLFEIDQETYGERMTRLLVASGMSPFRRRLAGHLSGGMKQKLGLACALVHAPRVLLLDEPTAGVDPVSRRDFWRILYQLREEGVTIVIATSYLDEAERCTRLDLLHRGRMLHCDTPSSLKRLMPGDLVSIVSSQARSVKSALVGLDGIYNVLLVGDGVHVVVDDASRRIPQLREALSLTDVSFDRAEQIPPSMEDLFVALMTESESRP